MSGTVETYNTWQDADGYWQWSYVLNGEELDQGEADTEMEARKAAHRSRLCDRDYETLSDLAEDLGSFVDSGGTLLVDLVELDDGSTTIRAWFNA